GGLVAGLLTGMLASGKFSGKSKVVTAEMRADPYHPDWKNYTGKDRGGVGADVVKGGEGIDKIFQTGRTPKASELKQYAESQGWKPTQTDGGPLKYVDENGIPRMTIKQGSSRAPGSADPHVEFKDATGQRTDAFGNSVTRKSPDNHTPIDFDL
ncbi:hypothetical protein, partial [Pseudomonas syringae]